MQQPSPRTAGSSFHELEGTEAWNAPVHAAVAAAATTCGEPRFPNPWRRSGIAPDGPRLAYLEPGPGSFLLQALVAMLAGAVVAINAY